MVVASRSVRRTGPTCCHAAELCAKLPQARCIDIEGGMVPLPDQLPERFASAVMDFLATVAGAD